MTTVTENCTVNITNVDTPYSSTINQQVKEKIRKLRRQHAVPLDLGVGKYKKITDDAETSPKLAGVDATRT